MISTGSSAALGYTAKMVGKRATKATEAGGAARRRLGVDGQAELLRDAALSVFAELGIEATSVEHVLERAQVSRQTFYRCYRNKAQLLDAVHRLVTDRLLAVTMLMRDEELSGDEALHKHLTLLFDHAASSGPIVCELEREAMRPESPFRAHRERRQLIAQQFVTQWVEHRFKRRPSPALVRAVLMSLEQLWLEVAQSSGAPRRMRLANQEAALELFQATLLYSGVERSAFAPRAKR